jgi:hypothetical protein
VVQNPAQLVSKPGQNPLPAGSGQAVNPAAESPRNPSQNPQKSSGPDIDPLAAILKAIPAEHRAELLRLLADRIDSNQSDSIKADPE